MKTANQLLQNNGVGLVTPKEGATDYIIPVCYDKASNVLKTKDENGDVIEIGGGLAYTEYVALLNVGTGVPVATVLSNSLGGTIAYSKNSTGFYSATITGAIFPINKTFLLIGTPSDGDFESLNGIGLNRESDTVLKINTNLVDGNASDSLLLNTAIEVRVYN